jgi:hypothetical protein
MKKEQFVKKIIWLETIGFLATILVIWLDELLDLPHLIFGALATPINFSESIFETILIALLAIIIIFSTHMLLQRLNYLEGILPVCSFCNKVRIKKQWFPIERYIREHSEADFSHSVCPECAEKHYEIKLNKT